MLNAYVQTCDHTHFWHLLEEIIMATSHIRAKNVAFSHGIGEVATISAGMYFIGQNMFIELLQIVVLTVQPSKRAKHFFFKILALFAYKIKTIID